MRFHDRSACLAVVLFVATLVPSVVAQSLQVVRADGTSTTLTAAQIAGAPHVTVDVKDHDSQAKFEGVPLSGVLGLAGVQSGGAMRGPQLSQALLVEASDGYKVVFALAEIDPDFATREIILADKRDGKPLDAKQGPFRIVAPGDKRPARWARMVTSLRIVVVK
jgi:hypothetical protein